MLRAAEISIKYSPLCFKCIGVDIVIKLNEYTSKILRHLKKEVENVRVYGNICSRVEKK